jgi:hypothetical protein
MVHGRLTAGFLPLRRCFLLKLFRCALVLAVVLGGWLLAALSLYVIRVPTPHKYLPVNIQLVTKKRLTFKDTWVDLSTWKVADLTRHQEFVDRLEEAGKGDLLRHAAAAILVENPPKMTSMPAPAPTPAEPKPTPAPKPVPAPAPVASKDNPPADEKVLPKLNPPVKEKLVPKESPPKRRAPFPDEIPAPIDDLDSDE